MKNKMTVRQLAEAEIEMMKIRISQIEELLKDSSWGKGDVKRAYQEGAKVLDSYGESPSSMPDIEVVLAAEDIDLQDSAEI